MEQRPVGTMPAPPSAPCLRAFRASPTPARPGPTHRAHRLGRAGVGGAAWGLVRLLAAAALLLGGAAAVNVSPGESFYVSGCLVEVIGCYFDSDGKQGCLPQPPKEPAAGCPADASRALPYSLPGCQPDPTMTWVGTKKAPSPPPCSAVRLPMPSAGPAPTVSAV